jgi:hypothetical protein
MADPRIQAPQDRRQNLTPLMRAKAAATTGEKVNFCPFGCTMEDLDDHGYCRHLVGFTNDGKTMEPTSINDMGRQITLGAVKQPVVKGDQLVPITVSSRVYRDLDAKDAKAGKTG